MPAGLYRQVVKVQNRPNSKIVPPFQLLAVPVKKRQPLNKG
jgi:hypothetical protein